MFAESRVQFHGEMQPLVAQLLARSVMLPQERLMQFGLDLATFRLIHRVSSPSFCGVGAVMTSRSLSSWKVSVRGTLDRLSQRVSLAILVAALLLRPP